jgi:hypothetical protein
MRDGEILGTNYERHLDITRRSMTATNDELEVANRMARAAFIDNVGGVN